MPAANWKRVQVASFLSILAIALFTGLMACFLVVIDPTLAALDAPAYTRVMQLLISHADHPPLVPLMVIVSLLAPVCTLWMLRRATRLPFFRYTAAVLLFVLAVFFITVVLNVPINTAIVSWQPQNPPFDWQASRAHWHLLNLFRTPCAAAALILHLLALYSRPDEVCGGGRESPRR